MISGRRIYIIGFMGSGKTTAGKRLATALGWQFMDLDKQIEHAEKLLIKDIFKSRGEDYFRKIEADILLSLQTAEDTVISTGGGTPCFGTNMEFMTGSGLVIYLRMTPAQLKSRLERSKKERPLLSKISKSELLNYIANKLKEREVYYMKASLVIDSKELDIRALASLVKCGF